MRASENRQRSERGRTFKFPTCTCAHANRLPSSSTLKFLVIVPSHNKGHSRNGLPRFSLFSHDHLFARGSVSVHLPLEKGARGEGATPQFPRGDTRGSGGEGERSSLIARYDLIDANHRPHRLFQNALHQLQE